MENNQVYYRIYFDSREQKVTIVSMQSLDENDYIEDFFFNDERGNKLKFDVKELAILWLNENILEYKIDPQYRRFDQTKFMKAK